MAGRPVPNRPPSNWTASLPRDGSVGRGTFLSRRVASVSSAECALQPKDHVEECQQCPEMVVVPAGSFLMGAPDSEVTAVGPYSNGGNAHQTPSKLASARS
jgi:formylglycine-generating enzyme required for sulfatase activity